MKNFLSRPFILAMVIAIFTVLGGVAGYNSLAYGQKGLLTGGGLFGGAMLGVFIAIVWKLMARLNE